MKKIVAIDDQKSNLVTIQAVLEDGLSDCKVLTALSGMEGIEIVKREQPDAILLDIMMHGLDGYETCRRIKETEDFSEIPIIFLTAKTDAKSLSNAFKAGGVDYISKPFRTEELLARVATHVELRKRRKELKKLNEQLEEKVKKRTEELEKSNAKLVLAAKDLEILDQAKIEFLRMVSHEIRTPLNGILGGFDLLKLNVLPNEYTKFIELMNQSTRRLERFSMQALHITELYTKGDTAFTNKKISISSFLESFIQEYAESNKTVKHRLVLQKATVDLFIQADPVYLREVLKIVVDNALTYSPDAKPVEIHLEEKEGKVVCTVRDHGSGFPENMLQESLMHFSPALEHSDRRTGLNLHLARMIMLYHKGNFLLANHPKGGGMVVLEFPV